MKKFLLSLLLLMFVSIPAHAQVLIPSEAYDNNRTAYNASETILTATNVNSTNFGKLFAWPTDAPVYAQPLYVPGTPNVLIVCTMNDTVYAFNADSTTATAPIWTKSLIPTGATSVPAATVTAGSNFLVGPVGIMSTPVYVSSTGYLYVVTFTQEASALVYRLHAISATDGSEQLGGPVALAPSSGGYTVTGQLNDQRSGLAEADGNIYVAFASWGDLGNYHGIIASYSETTLQQTGVFNDTPTGSMGGIWQGGRAPAVDSSGNVYYATGDGTNDNSVNFGESFIKFAAGVIGTTPSDWFTPSNGSTLFANDLDMNAPLLVPGTSLVLGSGKDSIVYVINTASMSHQTASDSGIFQEFTLPHGGTVLSGLSYNSTNNYLYVWPNVGPLMGFHFNGTNFSTTPIASSVTAPSGSHNPTLAGSPGIVWSSGPDISGGGAGAQNPGILRAFDASSLTELYNTDMVSTRDNPGQWSKFRSPVVDNGRVYLASASNQVNVYGLLSTGGGTGGGGSTSGNTATFVARDNTTSGSWHGVYGADGFQIANSTAAIPAYASLAVTGSNLYSWTTTPTSTAPYTTATGTTRLPSAWYTYTTETFDVHITDGNSHEISIYALDFDMNARSETIQAVDGDTGTNLGSAQTAGSIQNGSWFNWQISGHVKFIITNTDSPQNAVISGIFFEPGTGGGTGGGSSASSTITWSAVTGATSYVILRATTVTGTYTQVGTSTSTTFTDSTVSHGTTYYYHVVPVVVVP